LAYWYTVIYLYLKFRPITIAQSSSHSASVLHLNIKTVNKKQVSKNIYYYVLPFHSLQ
jgi:hypothetical protein